MTDKTVEVTDKTVEVVDKTVEVADKTVEVTDKTIEVTDKTIEVTDSGLTSIKWTQKIERILPTAPWLVCSFYRRPPNWSPSIERPLSG
ncbi:hypothetical protein ACMGD3_03335 [Lysinibacillus sphaericus]|uniref:hypothetical protein n=1 Tax=Lysinibacillus sphaericus TaxID=1421 RepID=UPI003F79FDCF